jgi:hypothetical protein
MTRKQIEMPQVRKPLLVGAGVVAGVAVVAFVMSAFVFGRTGGGPDVQQAITTTTGTNPLPTPSEAKAIKLNGGGRDPFAKGSAKAVAATAAPATSGSASAAASCSPAVKEQISQRYLFEASQIDKFFNAIKAKLTADFKAGTLTGAAYDKALKANSQDRTDALTALAFKKQDALAKCDPSLITS